MIKKLLLSFISITTLSLGLSTAAPIFAADVPADSPATAAVGNPDNSTKEPAKGSTDGAQAIQLMQKYVRVSRKSFVYNQKGKRMKKKVLKKGTIIYITSFNTVKGKALLGFSLGKKKTGYIKSNNVKLFHAVNYKLKKKALVYNKKGKKTGYYISKGKWFSVFKTKRIHGVNYVGSYDNSFIKWSTLDHKHPKVLN